MKPDELEKIDVLESTELQTNIPTHFLRLWRHRLRHIYKGGKVSEYDFDLLVGRFRDAVIVVPYYRDKDGGVVVVLRRGTRAAVFLRHCHSLIPEAARSAIFREVVAGGVEPEDYAEADGICNRAAKELQEEAGFAVSNDKLIALGQAAFSAPGFAIELLHFFGVEVIPTKRVTTSTDDAQEEVGELEFAPLTTALTMCRTGEIADQRTEVALFRLASHLGVIPAFGLNPRNT
jgi:8-oxo-dGTP pyrophosphatase MutT (NUDIX family)